MWDRHVRDFERLTKWSPVDGDMRLNTLSTSHNRIKHFKFGVLLENKSYYVTNVFKIHLLGILLLQCCGMINFSFRLRAENASFHIHFQRDPPTCGPAETVFAIAADFSSAWNRARLNFLVVWALSLWDHPCRTIATQPSFDANAALVCLSSATVNRHSALRPTSYVKVTCLEIFWAALQHRNRWIGDYCTAAAKCQAEYYKYRPGPVKRKMNLKLPWSRFLYFLPLPE